MDEKFKTLLLKYERDHESLSDAESERLFQYLVDCGLTDNPHGIWGAIARDLIDQGKISKDRPNVLKLLSLIK